MTDLIGKIKKKISVLNKNEKVYKGIDLTYSEQLYERGKPKKYFESTIELFQAINGKTILEIGCMRTPLVHSITKMNPPCCNAHYSLQNR